MKAFALFAFFAVLFSAVTGCKTTDVPSLSAVPRLEFSQAGKTITVKQTLRIPSGTTFDGQLPDGKLTRYIAAPNLGDGSQAEGQKPIFILEGGARIQNVIIGFPAADGIHVDLSVGGNRAVVDHVEWEDVGEDAITCPKHGDGEIILRKCKFRYATDKSIQCGQQTNIHVRAINCQWEKCQKAMRSGNAKGYDQQLDIEGGTVRDVDIVWMGTHKRAHGTVKGLKGTPKQWSSLTGGASVKIEP